MKKIINHYQTLFKKHGHTAQSLQWSSHYSQHKRFEILTQPLKKDYSIIDIGCGLGGMADHIYTKKHTGKYLGLDIVPEFISAAKEKFENNYNCEFELFDMSKDNIPCGYDAILLSGVFNNLIDDNWKFITSSLTNMYNATNNFVAINALSTYVDYRDEDLYYTDPCKLFDFCKKNISNKVTLQHNYEVKENSIPFEFSLFVYK